MPSPKNRIKLTGDTHPPEVEFDLGADDEALEPIHPDDEPSRVYADGWVPQEDGPANGARQDAGAAALRHRSAPPWMAIGAVLAVGFVVARLLRR